MQLNTLDVSNIPQHVLVFGPPKSGKTKLAGEVAKAFNTIWFDTEHGFLTLKQLPDTTQSNINLIQIPDDRANFRAIEAMLKVDRKSVV